MTAKRLSESSASDMRALMDDSGILRYEQLADPTFDEIFVRERVQMERAEAAEARAQKAEAVVEAARRWVRAKDDKSWSATKDWHKRHDKGKAEAALRAALTAYDASTPE